MTTMRQTIDCHLLVYIVCFTLWRDTMTNGFHYDSELLEKDESELQVAGSEAESATCVAEEPTEPANPESDIDFNDQP